MDTFSSTPTLNIRVDNESSNGSQKLYSWRSSNVKAPNAPRLKKKTRRRSSVSMQPLRLHFGDM